MVIANQQPQPLFQTINSLSNRSRKNPITTTRSSPTERPNPPRFRILSSIPTNVTATATADGRQSQTARAHNLRIAYPVRRSSRASKRKLLYDPPRGGTCIFFDASFCSPNQVFCAPLLRWQDRQTKARKPRSKSRPTRSTRCNYLSLSELVVYVLVPTSCSLYVRDCVIG